MARGFESKSVADQQEEAFRVPPPPIDREAPARQRARRRLELARADVLARLEGAHHEIHRQLLERSLQVLEEQLAALDRGHP